MTIDQLRELVQAECARMAKLGSVQAIASELRSRGMFGLLREGDECPLARGIADTLMMSTGRIWIQSSGISSTEGLRKDQPKSEGIQLVAFNNELHILSGFVIEFDAGNMPSLVE